MQSDDTSGRSVDLPTALHTAGPLKEGVLSWLQLARPELIGRRLELLVSEHPDQQTRRDAATLAEAADRDVLRLIRAAYKTAGELYDTVFSTGTDIESARTQLEHMVREDLVRLLAQRGEALRVAAADWPLVGELEAALSRLQAAEAAAARLQEHAALTAGQAQMVGLLASRLQRGDVGAVETMLAIHDLLFEAADEACG